MFSETLFSWKSVLVRGWIYTSRWPEQCTGLGILSHIHLSIQQTFSGAVEITVMAWGL